MLTFSLMIAMFACAAGDFDTGAEDTATEAHGGPQEAPARPTTLGHLPPAEPCDGAVLAPAMVYLDPSHGWSVAEWTGCATGVHIECPGWAATYTLREVVTGDAATFAAGPLVMDGAPRVARCGIVTDQGRGEVVIVWEG
jgi:hypothetical protein